ncbi:MAG: hypothetical protein JXB14_06240 [Candidatus Altiarchaeota archaeon]|nr:hypothetical protein [Candidatus Altiarchaeota archaeon]
MGLREIDRRIELFTRYKQFLPFVVIGIVVIVGLAIFLALQTSPSPQPPSGAVVIPNETKDEAAPPEEPEEEGIPNKMKPDFRITELKVIPETINTDKEVVITATLENRGGSNATSVAVRMLLGEKTVYSGEIPLFAIGSPEMISYNWTPTSADVGSITVSVEVDPENLIDEGNDRNNDEKMTIKVEKTNIIDITGKVKEYKKSFDEIWYSDTFTSPPDGRTEITKYFALTPKGTDQYTLNVAIAGIRAKRDVGAFTIQIPVPTESGWSSSTCIKESLASNRCIWNGPQIALKLSIDKSKGRLIVEDLYGGIDYVSLGSSKGSAKKIKKINFVGAQKADFNNEIQVFRVSGSPAVDSLVPESFYEIKDQTVYYTPLRWNPVTKKGELYMRAEFLIEVT